MPSSSSLRPPCPPGVCDCQREQLLADPASDLSILRLTRKEEKRLLERLEELTSLEDLNHLQKRMQEQLGIELKIYPGPNEVRSPRGLVFEFSEQPGLCRKIRQSLPTAIRRSMNQKPEILYQLLDSYDLFGNHHA
ncbi:hypothetical protein SAMN05660443_1478 [Marinospirillum celere]|uniref:Ribosomal protein S3AE n=1 Tax=Marinospirillum celere TaxID=1122252 RepID=A0A1I1GPT4_9GAMM|nr:hypothetical protein [Marinospirillum celere]SFC11898.1 hypothetical protein SAMN05660443_1478 [Marinospirillum celere]